MKKKLIPIICSALALLLFAGCKKDSDTVTAGSGKAAVLTASANTLLLSGATAANNAVTFNWTKADYSYNAAIQYTLQIDKKGNNFAAPKGYAIDASAMSQPLTVGDLNNALVLMGFTPDVAAGMEVRVKSELRPDKDVLYSNVLELMVTPYPVIINYPSIYVPAAYQGWVPATAERLSSVKSDSYYEGYVYFGDAANLVFKFTTDTQWTATYGWASSTNTDVYAGGTMSNGASGNLFVPSTGYYLLKADLTKNTWEAFKTTFGVIGDATPRGWDADTDMTFDPATKEWKVTLNLIGGKVIKFRANDDWAINYGNNDTPNGFLKADGKDITVDASGNYTIILKLGNPGNYTYTLTKN
jgi:hypothetical protein